MSNPTTVEQWLQKAKQDRYPWADRALQRAAAAGSLSRQHFGPLSDVLFGAFQWQQGQDTLDWAGVIGALEKEGK